MALAEVKGLSGIAGPSHGCNWQRARLVDVAVVEVLA